MSKIVKKSVAPFYLTAALWLGWAFFLPLYRLTDIIICTIVSFIIFILGKAIWPNQIELPPDAMSEVQAIQEDGKVSPPSQPAKPTGDPDLDKIIEQKDLAITAMRKLNSSIEDEKISKQIDHLEDITVKIITYIVENPQKKPQISRFMNYYLPTTLKLLHAYDCVDSTEISGANIDAAKGKIETMMDTVIVAFDKQLDTLFGVCGHGCLH
ncbi:5-bromo-4-chloroindolyl phosphate hydrolysis family protein [Anaerotruncus colihominis]|uniref:5-bromo-4-chloroindolyl phosphate hydrolysis family protein n=1 Tax=Anaerotruncus colihominis TaxID=169435 RepID=UPI0035134713